jgi:prepilin-type N-terminal cleavage/methylation domain-containing protein
MYLQRVSNILRSRLVTDSSGFTLIELIIVVQIIGILTMVAVPSYLGFRARAQKRTSAADVRSAIETAELYASDPTLGNGTYKNMTAAKLQTLDKNIKVDSVTVSTDFSTYCMQKTVSGFTSIVIRGTRLTNSGLVQENIPAGCPASAAL